MEQQGQLSPADSEGVCAWALDRAPRGGQPGPRAKVSGALFDAPRVLCQEPIWNQSGGWPALHHRPRGRCCSFLPRQCRPCYLAATSAVDSCNQSTNGYGSAIATVTARRILHEFVEKVVAPPGSEYNPWGDRQGWEGTLFLPPVMPAHFIALLGFLGPGNSKSRAFYQSEWPLKDQEVMTEHGCHSGDFPSLWHFPWNDFIFFLQFKYN